MSLNFITRGKFCSDGATGPNYLYILWTPAFKVNKKMFARLKEDGKTLVVYTEERNKWMQQDPGTFFITDHYKDYPLMLIDLARVKKKDLQQLLITSWQLRAPKSLQKQLRKQ